MPSLLLLVRDDPQVCDNTRIFEAAHHRYHYGYKYSTEVLWNSSEEVKHENEITKSREIANLGCSATIVVAVRRSHPGNIEDKSARSREVRKKRIKLRHQSYCVQCPNLGRWVLELLTPGDCGGISGVKKAGTLHRCTDALARRKHV